MTKRYGEEYAKINNNKYINKIIFIDIMLMGIWIRLINIIFINLLLFFNLINGNKKIRN